MTKEEATKIAEAIVEILHDKAEAQQSELKAKWEAEQPARDVAGLKYRVRNLEESKVVWVTLGIAIFAVLLASETANQFGKLSAR